MFGFLIHHHILIIDCWLSIKSPPKPSASLDASLRCTPFKHVLTRTHKGTPNREKGTPQGNKGIQTHEKPTNANEDNAIKGKEPQAIIGTPTKDVVAQVAKDNKLKEKVQEAKDSPTKQKPPLVKKSIPMRDKAPNLQLKDP
jgi:hypothetical protein